VTAAGPSTAVAGAAPRISAGQALAGVAVSVASSLLGTSVRVDPDDVLPEFDEGDNEVTVACPR
jgi:hypothetical protein